jgi:hypothetical protein
MGSWHEKIQRRITSGSEIWRNQSVRKVSLKRKIDVTKGSPKSQSELSDALLFLGNCNFYQTSAEEFFGGYVAAMHSAFFFRTSPSVSDSGVNNFVPGGARKGHICFLVSPLKLPYKNTFS